MVCHEHFYSGLGNCPHCMNRVGSSQAVAAHLAAMQQGSGIGRLSYGSPNNYDKQIKELERKFMEVQKLMVEEIEKLNEKILELENKLPTT